MRRLSWLTAVLAAGAGVWMVWGAAAARGGGAAGVAPAPAASSASGGVMAYVNGQPIAMNDLDDILVRGYGLPVAQQLIATKLAEQEARKRGIFITEDDVQKEHERTLRETFPTADNDDQREQLLDRLLSQRRVTRKEWMIIMRRNALLRKMAPPEMDQVTSEELHEEFGRQYGRKVVVRLIETATLAEAQKVRELATRSDFAELAVEHSINPSRRNGGLLPPIGPDTVQVSPALRQAALAMTKIGEVSDPIQTGTTFQVIKLVRIIDPKNVRFDDVKDKLAAALKEQKIRLFINQELRKLLASAKVVYVNPILKAQEARLNQGS